MPKSSIFSTYLLQGTESKLSCQGLQTGEGAVFKSVKRGRSSAKRRYGAVAAAGLLVALVVLSLLPSTGVSGTVTTTVNPTADAYVLQTSPSANFGTSTQLSASTSPITRSYLKFTVPTLSGAVTRATLRVYPTVSSPT